MISPSRMTRSTPPSRPWCSAVSMTSREPFVNCDGRCDLVADSSSSSTSGPTDPRLARKQDRMNAFNRFMVGCDCNRPTLGSIEAEGFEITKVEHTTAKKIPKFASPLIVGSADDHWPRAVPAGISRRKRTVLVTKPT